MPEGQQGALHVGRSEFVQVPVRSHALSSLAYALPVSITHNTQDFLSSWLAAPLPAHTNGKHSHADPSELAVMMLSLT